MISVVRLFGGLGNQMFQYAFGQRLASASGREISFDVENGFNDDFYGRKFSLDAFQSQLTKASRRDIPLGLGWRSPWQKLAKAGWKTLPLDRQRVIYERAPFQYDPTILPTCTLPGRYYYGYWQNEGYLLPIQDTLRHEFTLRGPLPSPLLALMEEMADCRSVSVHVRRNHGIGQLGHVHREAKDLHGGCDEVYFQKAAAEIGVTAGTVFYIFSDNLAWAKANLKLPAVCRYVSDLGTWLDVEELMLMAACQHHIISNSTFSWWGAWLGKNLAKVVVAPKIWMAGLRQDQINIYPQGWRRL